MGYFLDTWNETANYWGSGNATSETIDVLQWSTTREGSNAIAKEIDQSLTETGEAIADATQSVLYSGVKLLAIGGAIGLGYVFLKSYISKKGAKFGN